MNTEAREPEQSLAYTMRMEIERLTAENDRLLARIENANDAIAEIERWISAYPLDVFPKPDLDKARRLLAYGGVSLTAVSASNFRQVLEGVSGLIGRASEALKDSTYD